MTKNIKCVRLEILENPNFQTRIKFKSRNFISKIPKVTWSLQLRRVHIFLAYNTWVKLSNSNRLEVLPKMYLTRQTFYLQSRILLLKFKLKIRTFSSDLWTKIIIKIFNDVKINKTIFFCKQLSVSITFWATKIEKNFFNKTWA